MWFTFRQNNSGGNFNHDPEAGIGINVIVEAPSVKVAVARAEDIGLYFDGVGDCPCCGDRWYAPYDDRDATIAPAIYDEVVRQQLENEQPYLDWGLPSYIHPMDGKFYKAVKSGEVIRQNVGG